MHKFIRQSLPLLLLCFTFNAMHAQQEQPLPYADIRAYPDSFSTGSVLARFCDGMGFRFYWATDSLREEDLAYRPTAESRSTLETLEHIYGLSNMILYTALGEPVQRDTAANTYGYEVLRKRTLDNFALASKTFHDMGDEQLAQRSITFGTGESARSFPIWNLMNGPIADAIYHTGQVVSFRRISGNPIPSGVNVFLGFRQN